MLLVFLCCIRDNWAMLSLSMNLGVQVLIEMHNSILFVLKYIDAVCIASD